MLTTKTTSQLSMLSLLSLEKTTMTTKTTKDATTCRLHEDWHIQIGAPNLIHPMHTKRVLRSILLGAQCRKNGQKEKWTKMDQNGVFSFRKMPYFCGGEKELKNFSPQRTNFQKVFLYLHLHNCAASSYRCCINGKPNDSDRQ